MKNLKHTLLQAIVLAIFASVIGIGFNAIRAAGIPLVQNQKGTTPEGIQRIDIKRAKELFDKGDALFLDARSKGEYEFGYIKNAVNLPYDQVDDLLESALGERDFQAPIVTYCSGEECHSSDILASKLQEEGYTELYVFFSGWQKWSQAGYPVTKPKDLPLYKVGQ